MIEESRRRAYLSAMQVTTWLPRTPLPFAAPSRPALLAPAPAHEPRLPAIAGGASAREAGVAPRDTPTVTPGEPVEAAVRGEKPAELRTRPELPRPAEKKSPAPVEAEAPALAAPAKVAPPRFALQLLRAGACLLLVELPTGDGFQSRDPAYLLLKDLLRAAGLPDSPQLLGEPVRWPLLTRGTLDQGPDAARDFVQGFVAARMEEGPACACLWLVGLPAVRFAGEADAEAFDRELQVDGLGPVWALPGLEALMEEPARKASLWQAMRRVRRRWLGEAR
ncbi:hypothetical protein [Pseudomonas sp. RIT-PI-AD]|uniref:hypothetical protein n=1 Tax=Pseudomonas sp. RIT-PI-AD TaxID=3035294 RepID=UPI0021DA4BAF|nr:hypothetical protein [Pseudomonas sp. RIT-PI-AD]